MKKGKGSRRKRPIRNISPVETVKQFKAIKNKDGKINWEKSVRPNGKELPQKQQPKAKSTPASKVQTKSTPTQGLQRLRNQAAKSKPNPKIQMKTRQPVKGRDR